MRRSHATIIAAFALAACGGNVSTSDGSGAQAAWRPPIYTPPPEHFFVNTPDQDKQVAAQLLANNNVSIEYSALQQLAQTGVMTADNTKPVPDNRYCVLSRPMAQFLLDVDAAHIKMEGNLVYDGSGGYHSWPGSNAFPEAITNCINSASDIVHWQGTAIYSMQNDTLLTAIVDLIDSLPAGHYDIGFPRQPYPRGYSDPLGGSANDAKYQGDANVKAYVDAGGLKQQYDPETFHKFYWYGSNELDPCSAARNIGKKGYPATLPPNAATDVSGTLCTKDTDVLQQLNWIKDPNYRAQIIAAYQRAKARGASIDYTFGDGLNHLHLTVHLANQTHRVAYDFDRDGHADIPWVQTQSGEAAFWLLNKDAYKGNASIANANVPTGWKMLGAADVDGDMRNDLVYWNVNTGAISAWMMDDTAFRVAVDFSGVANDPDATHMPLEVGDFNGDGKPELFYCAVDANNDQHCDVRDFNGKQLSASFPALSEEWTTAGEYDVDGNGVDDIVWYHPRTFELMVWYLDNTASYSTEEVNVPSLADNTLTPSMVAAFDGPVGLLLVDHNSGKVFTRDLFSSVAPTQVNAPFLINPANDWRADGK